MDGIIITAGILTNLSLWQILFLLAFTLFLYLFGRFILTGRHNFDIALNVSLTKLKVFYVLVSVITVCLMIYGVRDSAKTKYIHQLKAQYAACDKNCKHLKRRLDKLGAKFEYEDYLIR